MKGSVIIAAAALGALVVAGCGSSGSSSSSTSCRAAASQDDASRRSASRARSPARWRCSGRSSCISRELALSMDNTANKTKITLVQGDTQLKPAQATTVTQQFTSNSKIVARGGPGRQPGSRGRRPADGPGGAGVHLRARRPNSTLTDRQVPDVLPGRVEGRACRDRRTPTTSSSNLHPKALMIVDDQEAYSTGLVTAMMPIFKTAGIKVDHESVSPEADRLLLAGGQGHARAHRSWYCPGRWPLTHSSSAATWPSSTRRP